MKTDTNWVRDVKLKTLKDFVIPREMATENPLGYRAVERAIEELKAEAVKWVKKCCGECRTDNKTCGGCKRFITFFNLIEEDLK